MKRRGNKFYINKSVFSVSEENISITLIFSIPLYFALISSGKTSFLLHIYVQVVELTYVLDMSLLSFCHRKINILIHNNFKSYCLVFKIPLGLNPYENQACLQWRILSPQLYIPSCIPQDNSLKLKKRVGLQKFELIEWDKKE